MPRSLSRRELIRKFRALGFSGPHSGKRHQFMKKGDLKIRIPNPHKSGTVDISLVLHILRQAGIEDEQWDRGHCSVTISMIFRKPLFLQTSAPLGRLHGVRWNSL